MENEQKNDSGTTPQSETQPSSPEPVAPTSAPVTPAPAPAEGESLTGDSTQPSAPVAPATHPSGGLSQRVRSFRHRFNIYFLLFLLVVVLGVVISIVTYQMSRESETTDIATQPLTEETIEQLRNSDVKIGDPKQTLSVESNAIFAGKVLVRDSLDVAGSIRVGGTVTLPGITVSGISSFEDVQANSLQVAGDAAVQGQLSVQGSLSVNGGGSFSGPLSAPQLTIDTLQINRDLQFNRHLDAGGPTPSKTDGTALGGGGTSSVSGTDTAGTVTINVGGGPGAGCFITVQFAAAFNGTPHVVITPVGSAAANLNYYINRNTTSFSICTTTPAPAGSSFSFDYIAID